MSERDTIVIKKYPNRRLYNTHTSAYITLDDLSCLIKNDHDLIVIDAKTGENLTRLTFTQIIMDHETKGYDMLPLDLLKQIIKLYDNSMAHTFRDYLLFCMEYFSTNQEQIKNAMNMIAGGIQPFNTMFGMGWEELGKQNAKFMDLFMNMITSFDNQARSGHKQDEEDQEDKK